MERVHLDFIGPLPRTERINEHIDQFIKWVECIPLPSGNTISLPSIIILGVYPVLLFTEDLNDPANCGRY
jgi:hypothetical protein